MGEIPKMGLKFCRGLLLLLLLVVVCSTSAWTRGGINYDLEVERNSYSASFALFRILLPIHTPLHYTMA